MTFIKGTEGFVHCLLVCLTMLHFLYHLIQAGTMLGDAFLHQLPHAFGNFRME